MDGADLRGLVADATATPRPKESLPKPDMFVYTFVVEGGETVRVPEHLLNDSQRELARRVLDGGGVDA